MRRSQSNHRGSESGRGVDGGIVGREDQIASSHHGPEEPRREESIRPAVELPQTPKPLGANPSTAAAIAQGFPWMPRNEGFGSQNKCYPAVSYPRACNVRPVSPVGRVSNIEHLVYWTESRRRRRGIGIRPGDGIGDREGSVDAFGGQRRATSLRRRERKEKDQCATPIAIIAGSSRVHPAPGKPHPRGRR